MSPVSLSTSDSTYILATGKAKLWLFLVGVNSYQDENFPSLRYSAVDCQGLGDALTEAAREFPQKQVIIHHDFAAQTPTLETVRTSLSEIILAAKPQDTVLFYFSGHGVLELQNQQVVLCLSDTQKDDLLNTALKVQELLQMLGSCAAHQQLVWLDACHSGSMTLRGSRGDFDAQGSDDSLFRNPTSHLMQVLRNRAAKSKGFYALLSCDQGQRSWEFPDLGHGLFTYYLMRGLRGEAADSQGVIEADGLYRYVYHQTLQYIDNTNQQLRLINQQKRSRRETPLYPEYPLQTPKRIVEGVGEVVLGLKSDTVAFQPQAQVSAEILGNKTSLTSNDVVPHSVASRFNQETLTETSGDATIVSTQPFIELNNHGQVLRFSLQSDRYKLGRDRKWSDIDITEKGWEVLSRHKAVLCKVEEDYRIYDGDTQKPSSNGIFLNHTRINTNNGYLLKHGMTFEIGQNPGNQILLTYLNPAKSQVVLPSKRRLELKALKDWPVILGREQQIDYYSSMQLDSPIVSRRHATIYRDVQGYRLENHSTNGTFVNGKAVEQPVMLRERNRIQIGPFTLLYQEEVLELVDRGSSIRLDAHNLRREVKDKELGKKLILNDVSLAIEPCQLVAVVGGSGAGKSTLMKTLLGIAPTTSGTVFLNGDDHRQHFDIYRSQIGYVPQDDIVHPDLTIEEVLIYACKLRLPPDTDVPAVVKHTLSQIMLSHVKNSFVRDLSGGQRKRVSIGVELLADPKLFFLDEPTSGLDPGLDKEMMKLLRELADQGRTVVIVTHATTNIEECDRIAFMGRGGKLCYFGPPKGALIFFEMPSEDLKYFADIYSQLDRGTTKRDTEQTVNYWAKKFLESSEYQSYIQASLSAGKPSSKTTAQKRVGVSFGAQLLLLSQRHLVLALRDRITLALSLLTGPIGIILIILTVQDKTPLASLDQEITQASLALRVLFVFSCVAIWVGLSSSVQQIVKESAIYARERLINLGLLPYIGSKFLIGSGIAILQTILIIISVLLGFDSPDSNLIFWPMGLAITNFLTLITSISLGLMLSAFVKNETSANSTLPLVMIPQIIFSGVLFELEGISSKISWLMPSRWSVGAYGALVNVNAMPNLPKISPNPLFQPFELNSIYDATWQNLGLNWGMLCLHTVIYLIIASYFQKRKDVF